jgi:hypothetical protein
MEATLAQYRALFGARTFVRSVAQGAAFLAASVIAIFAAVTYATTSASNHVTDIVLSNVGPFDMRFLFVYGTFIGFVIVGSLLAWKPNRLPFALKSMALFLLVRAVFVSLTHIAPSPIEPPTPAPFLNSIFYGSDQFFSGHTGMPFLLALAFWHMPLLRLLFLAATVFFGTIVLLGHYHYSIDVLAALFITHGIFQLACWLFPQDYALFRSSELQSARRSRKAAGEDATQDATNESPSGPKKRVRRRIGKWVAQARKPRASLPAAAASLPAPGERVVLHLVEKD